MKAQTNYVSVENLSKSYGELVLFEGLTFGISKGDKIAFVAKNGSGKSTILQILAGNIEPDQGLVVCRKGIKIAYLEQQQYFNENLTVEQVVQEADTERINIVKMYEEALKNPDDTEAYNKAFELMDANDAWDFQNNYQQVLSKLKFSKFDQPVRELSGGQLKRLGLAIALISKPDLLILDEPTNHLDLEMIEWLESFFAKEKMTLFMVTHDRYFLERVCNEIIELDKGNLYKYKGNYSYYLEKKQERQEQQEVVLNKAKLLFKKELDWMRRQPKARTTKSKSRIDDFFAIKKIAHQRRATHEVQLEINMERLGNKIVEMHHVDYAYQDLKILDDFNHVFKRGERIGIVGKNGTGKSSFLNLITGVYKAQKGKIICGETVKFGYYNQQGIKIKPGQKVIDVVLEYGAYIPLAKGHKISASQLLERFLFDRKKQHDFVEKLSGGEQKRLYLCVVLIQNPNFLILDEPTNDLDIVTLNVLESFLLDYPGNLLVVSHDRYFMDKIVDSLFVFEGQGKITHFPGNYTDYRVYESSTVTENSNQKVKPISKPEKKNTGSVLSYMEKREYGALEGDIERLENKKKTIEDLFANNLVADEDINTKSKELQEIIEAIDEKEMRWFELSSKIEDAQN